MIERSVVENAVTAILLEQLKKQFRGSPNVPKNIIESLIEKSLLRLEPPLGIHLIVQVGNTVSEESKEHIASVVSSVIKEKLAVIKHSRIAAIVSSEVNRLLASDPRFNQLSLKLLPYVCEQLILNLSTEFSKALEVCPHVTPETIVLLTEMSLMRLDSVLAQSEGAYKFSQKNSAAHKEFQGLVASSVAPLLQLNFAWIKSIEELPLTDKLKTSAKCFVYPPVEKKTLVRHIAVTEKAPTLESDLHALVAEINKVCGLIGPSFDRSKVIDCFYRQFQMGTDISLEFLQKISFLKNLYTSYQEQNHIERSIKQQCVRELSSLQQSLDLSIEEESRVEQFCSGLIEPASKKMLATQKAAYAEIRKNIKEQMVKVEENRDQRLAEERAKIQPAIDMLKSLYDCAAKIYVTNKVYQKQPTLEKFLELQTVLTGHAKRHVERTATKDQSPDEKEIAIKLKISEFKKQLFESTRETFPKYILKEDHEKCFSLVDKIKDLSATHNAFAMPRDIYIDEKVNADFQSSEESIEYNILSAKMPLNPAVILHSEAEMQRFTKVVAQLAQEGKNLARDPQKKDKGNALVKLSATLTTEAANHYREVHLVQNVPGDGVQRLRDDFKARVAEKFDQTYNDPSVGHHCNDWKKVRVKFMNILFIAFLPLKKLLTNTWFFQPTTNTQDIVTEAKDQAVQVLKG